MNRIRPKFRICHLCIFIAVLQLTSCGVLSQRQLEMVSELALRADSTVSVPSAVFSTLAEIRLERGLFYAASLTSPEARFAEVEALSKGSLEDGKILRKTDAYIGVINSYLRVLRSLGSDERWRAVGREVRSIGREVDSMILFYNSLTVEEKLPQGLAQAAGKTFGSIGEQWMKGKRAKVLREAVIQGDTLVSMCVDSLIGVLRSEQLEELIVNENLGLKDNYRAFLNSAYSRSETVGTDADRKYIELYTKISAVGSVRNKCVSALRSLKKAHHRLAESFESEDAKDFYPELLEFNEIAAELCRQIREL